MAAQSFYSRHVNQQNWISSPFSCNQWKLRPAQWKRSSAPCGCRNLHDERRAFSLSFFTLDANSPVKAAERETAS